MNDDDAEEKLKRLLVGAITGVWVTRAEALLSDNEDADIEREHSPTSYGAAWDPQVTPNTLRMLHKLRGVERLRVNAIARQATHEHEYVLRVRPDLELLAPLALPPWLDLPAHAAATTPPPVTAAAVPWMCEHARLASDQLLLLPGDSVARRLGALYEPGQLARVLRATPADEAARALYPERILWHALRGREGDTDGAPPVAWPGGVTLQLMSGEGSPRDAYAKLRRDFPECFAAAPPV